MQEISEVMATARPILCQIVRFKSGFMTRWRAQNGAIPTFTDIAPATWDGHQETPLLYPPHVLLTVKFTLSMESVIILNSFQAHLAWSSFHFNIFTKIWFQFLIIKTWDGPLIFCWYYITYCGLKAIEAVFGLMRNLLSSKKYHGLCFIVYCYFGGFASRLWSNIFLPPTVREREEGRGVTEFDGQIMEILSITSSFHSPFLFLVKHLFLFLIYEDNMNTEKSCELVERWMKLSEQPSQCSCCAVCGPI